MIRLDVKSISILVMFDNLEIAQVQIDFRSIDSPNWHRFLNKRGRKRDNCAAMTTDMTTDLSRLGIDVLSCQTCHDSWSCQNCHALSFYMRLE